MFRSILGLGLGLTMKFFCQFVLKWYARCMCTTIIIIIIAITSHRFPISFEWLAAIPRREPHGIAVSEHTGMMLM